MKQETQELTVYHVKLARIVESALFRNGITLLIIVNALALGVLTYDEFLQPGVAVGLELFDFAVTLIFAIEIGMKLTAYRFGFFRLGWNWFDFIVIGMALIPGAHALSVLRAMRVLRILRLLHVVPMLRRITEALLKALPGMGAIVAVLTLVTYVGAVMATNMFGNTDNPEVAQLFGDLPSSAFSLFQVMTMDGWRFEVVQKVIDDGHPYAPIFFLIFIFIASFAVLNLFIALIVDALAAEQRALTQEQLGVLEGELDEELGDADRERKQILSLLEDMKREIQTLKSAQAKPSAPKDKG